MLSLKSCCQIILRRCLLMCKMIWFRVSHSRCVCVCVYVCVCTCVCVYIRVFTCVYVCLCVCKCVCLCVRTCVYVCVRACVYMCVFVLLCVCLCLFVCVRVCAHVRFRKIIVMKEKEKKTTRIRFKIFSKKKIKKNMQIKKIIFQNTKKIGHISMLLKRLKSVSAAGVTDGWMERCWRRMRKRAGTRQTKIPPRLKECPSRKGTTERKKISKGEIIHHKGL